MVISSYLINIVDKKSFRTLFRGIILLKLKSSSISFKFFIIKDLLDNLILDRVLGIAIKDLLFKIISYFN